MINTHAADKRILYEIIHYWLLVGISLHTSMTHVPMTTHLYYKAAWISPSTPHLFLISITIFIFFIHLYIIRSKLDLCLQLCLSYLSVCVYPTSLRTYHPIPNMTTYTCQRSSRKTLLLDGEYNTKQFSSAMQFNNAMEKNTAQGQYLSPSAHRLGPALISFPFSLQCQCLYKIIHPLYQCFTNTTYDHYACRVSLYGLDRNSSTNLNINMGHGPFKDSFYIS